MPQRGRPNEYPDNRTCRTRLRLGGVFLPPSQMTGAPGGRYFNRLFSFGVKLCIETIQRFQTFRFRLNKFKPRGGRKWNAPFEYSIWPFRPQGSPFVQSLAQCAIDCNVSVVGFLNNASKLVYVEVNATFPQGGAKSATDYYSNAYHTKVEGRIELSIRLFNIQGFLYESVLSCWN
jgi:hypothetical protein